MHPPAYYTALLSSARVLRNYSVRRKELQPHTRSPDKQPIPIPWNLHWKTRTENCNLTELGFRVAKNGRRKRHCKDIRSSLTFEKLFQFTRRSWGSKFVHNIQGSLIVGVRFVHVYSTLKNKIPKCNTFWLQTIVICKHNYVLKHTGVQNTRVKCQKRPKRRGRTQKMFNQRRREEQSSVIRPHLHNAGLIEKHFALGAKSKTTFQSIQTRLETEMLYSEAS